GSPSHCPCQVKNGLQARLWADERGRRKVDRSRFGAEHALHERSPSLAAERPRCSFIHPGDSTLSEIPVAASLSTSSFRETRLRLAPVKNGSSVTSVRT